MGFKHQREASTTSQSLRKKEDAAHAEPICKELSIIKNDLYVFSLCLDILYKFMNCPLPSYFKPELPSTCTRYELRKPLFRLTLMKFAFAEQSLRFVFLI